jgi:hypothetical protein
MAAVARSAEQKVRQPAGLRIDCDLLETWSPIDSNNGPRVFFQKQ